MTILKHEYEALDGLLTMALEIDYDATPIREAVINADPDDCHPKEGGIEINGVRVVGITANGDHDACARLGLSYIDDWLSEAIVTALHEPDTFWIDLVADHLDEQGEAAREAAEDERERCLDAWESGHIPL